MRRQPPAAQGRKLTSWWARVIAASLRAGAWQEGTRGQVFLLSGADDPETIRLARPILNDTVSARSGKTVAWTQAQRYLHLSALLAPGPVPQRLRLRPGRRARPAGTEDLRSHRIRHRRPRRGARLPGPSRARQGTEVVLVLLPPAVGRAIDRATGSYGTGPILLNRRGTQMDRHAATRRLQRPASDAGVTMAPFPVKATWIMPSLHRRRQSGAPGSRR